MKRIQTIKEVKNEMCRYRSEGQVIGFVPTMGYLHEGHLSLVRESIKQTDRTAVSVYVNPKQFGPDEDYLQYPRDIDRDADVLEKEGVDVLFTCQDREMYPKGYKTYVEVQDYQDVLCGASRPGHFRGVCTVVLKLFQIIKPDIAFFGQKDAQQAVILKKMVKDLNAEVKISVHPIVREKDGLALSSRNALLRPRQRKAALCLYQSLQIAKQAILKGQTDSLKIIHLMKERINKEKQAQWDYVEIVDKNNLESLSKVIKGETLIALAVYIGQVRLIDNIII
ncbi:MAG: pantoate--beta-alanine ligase [Candidatus Aminicenantes bacterium]|nr:pantoate--beta-alanine ligase [Candidatus Aminicenantes bacterium]